MRSHRAPKNGNAFFAVSSHAQRNLSAPSRACALKCEASGYGVITSDKKFLKFRRRGKQADCRFAESFGQKRTTSALTLPVTLKGDTLKVTSVKLL